MASTCQTSTPSAATHAPAPSHEIQDRLPVFDASFTFARFTAAKMSRKPALPMREMLVRSNALATTSVTTLVTRSPSSGLCQTFFSNTSGSSPDLAMVNERRAAPYSVALMALAVDSSAAKAIVAKPACPMAGLAASASA